MEVAVTQSPYPESRRAAVLSDFGEAHNFSVREVPTPAPRSDEMLVRVKATSVNPIEWKMRRGLGLPKAIWRLLLGRPMILGIDFSGTVVAAGPEVEAYRIGDDVMGAFRLWGADAEYVVVRPAGRHTAVAIKPSSISYAEAAAVCFAGLVALAGMRTHGGGNQGELPRSRHRSVRRGRTSRSSDRKARHGRCVRCRRVQQQERGVCTQVWRGLRGRIRPNFDRKHCESSSRVAGKF
jgi:hypothetical protein